MQTNELRLNIQQWFSIALMDGSGYHRGASAAEIGMPARVLATDAYHTMLETRAYRPPVDSTAAKQNLREESRAGRLDGLAVDAMHSVAGHRVRRTRRDWPAGLTTREVEVLRHAVRGAPNRVIAGRLHISERALAPRLLRRSGAA